MGLFILIVVCLVAGVVSGIIGTGSSIMLVLASVYRPKEAVPIMAAAAVMANALRIQFRSSSATG